ncbi:hypothetical protein IFR05_003022 [Cadophora sp. M221]|nr:hypothetical protein IFR05_003022 [Cadophora sp. M221]
MRILLNSSEATTVHQAPKNLWIHLPEFPKNKFSLYHLLATLRRPPIHHKDIRVLVKSRKRTIYDSDIGNDDNDPEGFAIQEASQRRPRLSNNDDAGAEGFPSGNHRLDVVGQSQHIQEDKGYQLIDLPTKGLVVFCLPQRQTPCGGYTYS